MGEDSAKNSEALFPILPSHSGPLAARVRQAPLAGEGHHVRFRLLQTRSLLNRSVSRRRLSLDWSINPYRGCEFGCRYCYARYTHPFLSAAAESTPPDATGTPDLHHPQAFEREIYIKDNAAWLLQQELRQLKPNGEIALGTATDPYQPIERTARVTQSLLAVFARYSGLRLGIVTKSNLIVRDLALLQAIAARNTLVVHLTITTTDTDLARKLEPRAPRPDLRFAALAQLRQGGIVAGVLASPLLPGLTDNEASLTSIASEARRADASFLAAEPLFLKSCSRPTYMSFVREHFPDLEAENAARFAHAEFASRPYRQAMQTMVQRVCRRSGLRERSTDALLTRVVRSTDFPHGELQPTAPASPGASATPLQPSLF